MRSVVLFTILLIGFSQNCQLGNGEVCGSDNITYRNLCELNKSFAVLKHPGRCILKPDANDPSQSVANCTEDFIPVCGEDGITYGNECRMKFRGLQKAHDGVCGVDNFDASIFSGKICACSYEWHPVCTRHSKVNFENLCLVRCIHQLEGSFDSCHSPCNCPTNYDPVCSVKGITFDNQCQLECANQVKGLNGECESILYDCNGGCSKTFAPICGQDGKTYRNKCFATCSNIPVKSDGICDSDSNDPSKQVTISNDTKFKTIESLCDRCSREIKISPVCAEDGTTFENECQCQCQNNGVCPKYADGPCPSRNMFSDNCSHCKQYPAQSVCGNDFKTYENLCYLECNRVALYKRGDCNSFAPKSSSTFDMRTNNFARLSPKPQPSHDALMQQAQSLINQVSEASANGQQINPAITSAMLSIIEAIKQLKNQ